MEIVSLGPDDRDRWLGLLSWAGKTANYAQILIAQISIAQISIKLDQVGH